MKSALLLLITGVIAALSCRHGDPHLEHRPVHTNTLYCLGKLSAYLFNFYRIQSSLHNTFQACVHIERA